MRSFIIGCFLIVASFAGAQETKQLCTNPKFEKTIDRYIDRSVRILDVEDLNDSLEHFIILDTRELEEYEVSHIPGAIYFGYDDPEFDLCEELDKDAKIVVYCSIGYRSEKIGEQLQERGYSDVSNLYGSIFEWANQSYPLENETGETTNELHTYNKLWSKWVQNKNVIKIH